MLMSNAAGSGGGGTSRTATATSAQSSVVPVANPTAREPCPAVVSLTNREPNAVESSVWRLVLPVAAGESRLPALRVKLRSSQPQGPPPEVPASLPQ